ncbi:MAG: ABC-F family ATP-binding cassette domain-containing protein [Lachnospiraceae bacterium]|nr:ABC-F family ATP-binding cassette domain-containing protein [Lachnospiraceae bacterium]
MILTCHHIAKAFGEEAILKEVTFHLEEREKASVVGINGSGKSTLLKIIAGKWEADSGEAVLSRDKTIGYLAQNPELSGRQTIYETLLEVKTDLVRLENKIRSLEKEMARLEGEALSLCMESYDKALHEFENRGGYAYRSEITGTLKGLGFTEEEFQKPVEYLSGGQKTRVFLGRLLLEKPDLLLLDEPTNHLDLNSIVWLENFLNNYPGAVLIVAHDRYFLDRIVTKIIELERGSATVFSGNYTAYSQKKAALREARLSAYLKQQAEIKHQEAVIEKLRSFNREKSIRRAESREKMLEKITPLEKPTEEKSAMTLTLSPQVISGNDVLTVRGLSKSYGDQTLFSRVDLDIKRGERVAIIGNNGTGKTTLLKIINNLSDADSGRVVLGSKVHIGYYDQEHQILHKEKTIFEEIQDAYPSLSGTRIRNMLAAFLFTADDVFKRIGDLSGGERGRVSLAKLMLSQANFLILDEPTNHLDMTSKEILEQALNRYTGTILYVSHDRYFINATATRILELSDRAFINYLGNYDYYREKKDACGPAKTTDSAPAPDSQENAGVSKNDWLAQKEELARIRKRQNDLKKTEEQITEKEREIEHINRELSREEIYADPEETMKYQKKLEEAGRTLEDLYERWTELAEEAASDGSCSSHTTV